MSSLGIVSTRLDRISELMGFSEDNTINTVHLSGPNLDVTVHSVSVGIDRLCELVGFTEGEWTTK